MSDTYFLPSPCPLILGHLDLNNSTPPATVTGRHSGSLDVLFYFDLRDGSREPASNFVSRKHKLLFLQAVRRVGVFRYLVQLPTEEHMRKPRAWTAALLRGKEQCLHFPAGWQECTAFGTSLNVTTVGVSSRRQSWGRCCGAGQTINPGCLSQTINPGFKLCDSSWADFFTMCQSTVYFTQRHMWCKVKQLLLPERHHCLGVQKWVRKDFKWQVEH